MYIICSYYTDTKQMNTQNITTIHFCDKKKSRYFRPSKKCDCLVS